MLSPGPEQYPNHKVSTIPMRERVEIFVAGHMVVETKSALRLFETGYNPVIYVPRADIRDIQFIKASEYHCPFKGYAEIYDIKYHSTVFKNAAWSYVKPYDDMLEIKNMIAFYPNKVQEIKVIG